MSARTIRTAGPDDAAVIHRFIVGLAVYEREPDAVENTPDRIASQLRESHPPFECLLLEENGEALGMALYFRNYSTWTGEPGFYLEDLYVPEEHRRKGVGIALMRRLARIAVERGYTRIDWSVLDWNEPSLAFYRSMGGKRMSEWEGWRLDGDALAAMGAPES